MTKFQLIEQLYKLQKITMKNRKKANDSFFVEIKFYHSGNDYYSVDFHFIKINGTEVGELKKYEFHEFDKGEWDSKLESIKTHIKNEGLTK